MIAQKISYKYSLIFICLIVALFVFLFSGYSFYTADEYMNQLPGILHLFDGELFNKDYEMQIIYPLAFKNLPHLTAFLFSKITRMPLDLTYFVFYVLIVCGYFFVICMLSWQLGRQFYAGLAACLLIILFSQNKVLQSSGFSLVDAGLTSRFIGTLLHLSCCYLMLLNRTKLAVIISALTFYVHGHSSLWTILPILVVSGCAQGKRRDLPKHIILFLAIILLPLIQLLITFKPFNNYPSHYSLKEFILFRIPHHIFPANGLLNTMIFLIISIVLFFCLRPRIFQVEISYWILTLTGIYFCGIIFTRFLPMDFVMAMYAFRVDVYLRIFYFVLLSVRIFDMFSWALKRKLLRTYRWPWLFFITIQMLFLIRVYILSPARISFPCIHPPQNEFTDVANYVKLHIPKRSLLITPPNIEGFRLYSERSIVVDFKTFVLGWGTEIQDEWMRRIFEVCNVKQFKNRGWEIRTECEEGFRKLNYDQMEYLCHEYDADYFVTYADVPIMSDGRFQLLYKNSKFGLMRCPRSAF
jgi:hypothetical protein